MNKGQRHIKIRDIITNNDIETQDELVEELKISWIQCNSSHCFKGY